MKKIISLILISIIFLSVLTVAHAEDIKLKDIEKHWAKSNIEKLISMGIVDGYKDGTFKPDNTLKFEEFIKMLVTATEKEKVEAIQGEKWYKAYIDIALENNYISKDMEKLIDTNIDRKTMAEIIYNLIAATDGMVKLNEKEIKFVASKFTDLKVADEKVLHIAAMGIINGYLDKTFKPTNSLKRCEATTVILRILDKSLRTSIEIVLPKELSDFPEPVDELDYLYNYPCHIWNKPNTVSELNQSVRDSYRTDEIVQSVTDFMDMVSNTDYSTISLNTIKNKLIYNLHDSTEYRGTKYDLLADGRFPLETDGHNWFDIFINNYVKDIKDSKIKIQGKYYTSEDLCILHNNTPTSRGILRFKVESAKDLELVKHILFIRDTEREKKDILYAELDYGGVDNSRYIKNSDIKLKLNTWYEIAMDVTVYNVLKSGAYVYENYETSDYKFAYICPIYIKELK